MSAKTTAKALGLLQDDPDNEEAWGALREAVGSGAGDETAKLLEAARRAHEARREHDAVAHMLEVEVMAARGTPREAELQAELARVLDEDLLDEIGATAAYKRLLELRPGD